MTTRNAQRVEQLHAYIANTRARLETEQRRQQAERDRENQAARDRWQAKLAADREAEQQRAAAEFEALLAPTKERLKREWLANHPDPHARRLRPARLAAAPCEPARRPAPGDDRADEGGAAPAVWRLLARRIISMATATPAATPHLPYQVPVRQSPSVPLRVPLRDPDASPSRRIPQYGPDRQRATVSTR